MEKDMTEDMAFTWTAHFYLQAVVDFALDEI
jgi:hypothetical protein